MKPSAMFSSLSSRVLPFVTLALLAVAGCNKTDASSSSSSSSSHAKATPGSHEDWCDEHAVPESQCTRCNPELAAAFKATKDWCPEHGLPESQCLKCNPTLQIVRPPATSAKAN